MDDQAKDAARWREVQARFDSTKTSQAERIIDDLDLRDHANDNYDFASMIDSAIAEREAKERGNG